jgi:hypothetical protein
MRKKKIILSIVLLPLLAIGAITAYGYFFPDALYQLVYRSIQDIAGNRAQQLETGQTYRIDDRVFRFVDDKRFFYLKDFADYENQEELEDYRWEMEDESIVPYLIIVEGDYSRKGDAIYIKETRGVLLTFDRVQDVKDRFYTSLDEIAYVETGYVTEPQLVKTEKGYQFNQNLYIPNSSNTFEKIGQLDSFPVYETNEKLPDTIEQFLSDYQAKKDG